MSQLKGIVLALCFCCILAGTVRLVFPESSLKPVINAVLVLYILSTFLHCISGFDSDAFRAQVFTRQMAAVPEDYSAFVQDLYANETCRTVRQSLQMQQIDASVLCKNNRLIITLSRPDQRQSAAEMLDVLLEPGSYELLSGEGGAG